MQIQVLSDKRFMVHSDSGKIYTVKLSGESASTISCDCVGFRNRRRCKHVEEVRTLLREQGKTVKVQKRARDAYDYILPYKKEIAEYLGVEIGGLNV